MKILDKSSNLLAELKSFEELRDISENTLEWLIEIAEYGKYETGETTFKPGDPIEQMYFLLRGEISFKRSMNGDFVEIARQKAPSISGLLPYSRMKSTTAIGEALEDCYALFVHKDFFPEIGIKDQALMQALVAVMTSRVRTFTHRQTQNEKLMALGKISAGLAHELNNPASAMVRSADELYKRIHYSPERFKGIIKMNITAEQTDQLNGILYSRIKEGPQTYGLMEREERLDELVDWMDDRALEHAEDIAETFVDFGISTDELDKIQETVNGQDVGVLLWWFESTLNLEKLVLEIQEAADRISKLVKSVKTYSHMDQGVGKESTNIHDGIKSTLTMLGHKLKKKQIKVIEDYDIDLPKIPAVVGELNQVWTNLIDNAIDALDQQGMLTIKTYSDKYYVCVDVIDNGAGMPEEVKNRIFEPFFTTKGIGEGTGMGLDIVKKILDRHQTKIEVASVEGQGTTFKLCFPTNV